MRRPVGKLIRIAFLLLLSGCSPRPTAALLAEPDISRDTPTRIVQPTRRATATADFFELRSTSTPIPSLTPLKIELLPGYGYGPGSFPSNINPLTGLQVSEPALLERRPLVIKITNFPRSARPQWGLNAADHVYEYYLEDELTRFIAIYYGKNAEQVGPIRSGRPFDEQIVRAYKAVFAFAYADNRLIKRWEDSNIAPFLVIEHPDNCPPMCRKGSKTDYNTLFTDTAALSQDAGERSIDNTRQDLNGLRFEENTLITFGGGSANQIETRFSPMSYHYWVYQPESKRYARLQDADRRAPGLEEYEPLRDNLDQQQVQTDNLVYLLVPMLYDFKSNSTEVYNFQMVGRGKAFAAREGRMFLISWFKPAMDSMIQLQFPNGTPYPLKPGSIFFEVLSDKSTYRVDGQKWGFQFSLLEEPAATQTPLQR